MVSLILAGLELAMSMTTGLELTETPASASCVLRLKARVTSPAFPGFFVGIEVCAWLLHKVQVKAPRPSVGSTSPAKIATKSINV